MKKHKQINNYNIFIYNFIITYLFVHDLLKYNDPKIVAFVLISSLVFIFLQSCVQVMH